MGNVTMPYQFAEAAVLGSVMMGRSAHDVILRLTDEDFDNPRHKLIASAQRKLIRDGIDPDPITVSDELAARSVLSRIGGSVFLHDLVGMVTTPLSAPYYAAIVREAARVRQTHAAGVRLTQMTTAEESAEDLPEILIRVRADLDAVPPPFAADEEKPATLRELLAKADEPEDWMIPGLIERGERVVITGGEGMAKSTIMRQFAACLAAGLHPWTGRRVADGFRVLHIDTENNDRQLRRGYLRIGGKISRLRPAPNWEDRIHPYSRIEGLDLAGKDRGWFHHVAELCSPDLIIIAPAYKVMIGRDPDKERDILALLGAIDEVRTRHDAAVMIEAHSGNGSDGGERPVRPIGSSVWRRWPEVGFGLRVDVNSYPDGPPKKRPEYLEAVQFRGQREDRDWPDLLAWGPPGGLDWVANRGDYEMNLSASQAYEIPAVERGAA
jgi:replicative DNA helicase